MQAVICYEAVIMRDMNEAKTMPVKECVSCGSAMPERDRFCRRCGAKQAEAEDEFSPARDTAPLRETTPHREISGPLIKAVTADLAARASIQLFLVIARSAVLLLISVPIWLIIILLSPLDAYAAAKGTLRQIIK